MPKRIQLKRTKGWRIPPNTVVVSRPSKWGNPFSVKTGHTKKEAVMNFKALMLEVPGKVEEIRRELAGKNLACWCGDGPCHADVLLEIANAASLHAGAEEGRGNG